MATGPTTVEAIDVRLEILCRQRAEAIERWDMAESIRLSTLIDGWLAARFTTTSGVRI